MTSREVRLIDYYVKILIDVRERLLTVGGMTEGTTESVHSRKNKIRYFEDIVYLCHDTMISSL